MLIWCHCPETASLYTRRPDHLQTPNSLQELTDKKIEVIFPAVGTDYILDSKRL